MNIYSDENENWSVAGNIPLSEFVIQSHRGAGFLAPDNTMEAFELGWSLGMVPESDIRTTKDGVIVAFHDSDFQRTVHDNEAVKHLGVADFKACELANLRVGADIPDRLTLCAIPSLSEILSAMKGRPERRMYFDIKDVNLSQLAAEIQEAGIAKQAIFACPNPAMIEEWHRLIPDAHALLWMSAHANDGKTATEVLEAKIAALEKRDFIGITQLQIHIYPAKNPTPDTPFAISSEALRRLRKKLRARGILFQAYPCQNESDPATYRKLLDLGVQSFASNFPDVVKTIVSDYYRNAGL